MRFPTIKAAAAASILAFVMRADAFWRLGCESSSGYARIDPLVSPGAISSHMHSVFGSSGFSETSGFDALRAGSCTSCAVAQDRSAYWHPALYFKSDADGTYTAVNQKGGMLAYYLLYGDNITAFPKDFAMIAGDSTLRTFNLPIPDPPLSEWGGDPQQNTQAALRQKALGFNCLNYAVNTPEGSLYRHFMPDKSYLDANCLDGLRFELMFPSCWNEAAGPTSHNNRDHMAYPSLVKTGDCPSGFSTRVPSLFYEIIYDTYAFHDQAGEFIISNGDPTGFGYHGDFVMGWDVDFLQNAVDTCTNPTGLMSDCPLFTLQDNSVSAACNFDIPDALKGDDPKSPGTDLPGKVKVVASGGVAAAAAAVPTLSYSAGPSTNIAGGIFAAVISEHPSPSSLSSQPPPAATTTTPPPPPPPSTPSPTPTPAPPTTNALLPGEVIVSTMYSTLADKNEVLELVLVEEEVTVYVSTTATATVTATAPAAAIVKRRKHRRHGHGHGHEGSS